MLDTIGGIFTWEIISTENFKFMPLHILLIIVIYLATKIFIKYIKRYFKTLQLTEKQLTIEGKEIAVWRLTKQIIYLIAFYLAFTSLSIKNPNLDPSNLLGFEFVRVKSFHIAVYHILLLIAVVFAARVLINFIKIYLHKAALKNEKIDSGTEYIYIQLAKYIVYGISIIVVLRSFGIDLDLFIGATTFLLVGIALGLQTIFRDYFSGLLLLFEGTFKVGDIVEIETLNSTQENFVAKVVQINLRTSKVETRDNKVLIIPNSKLTHESVINWSLGNHITRFTIPITFHYGVDTEKVQTLLISAALGHPHVVKSKKPFVRLLNFGQDGLEMDLVFWADQNLYIERLKSDIRFKIDEALRANNISVPYPQTDIHLKKPAAVDDIKQTTDTDF
jgi:small-conductance mechanosensitive channel